MKKYKNSLLRKKCKNACKMKLYQLLKPCFKKKEKKMHTSFPVEGFSTLTISGLLHYLFLFGIASPK